MKILLRNPEAIDEWTIPDRVVKAVLKEVESDNDLNSFYSNYKKDFETKIIIQALKLCRENQEYPI